MLACQQCFFSMVTIITLAIGAVSYLFTKFIGEIRR